MALPYLEGTVVFITLVYLWETYLQLRQHWKFSETHVPKRLEGLVDHDTYTKSRLYGQDKSSYNFASSLFSQVESTLVLLFGGIPFLWAMSGDIIGYYGFGPDYEKTQSMVFLLLVTVIESVLSFPWGLYYTFVIEQRHGFNKQTLGFYIKDKIKGLLVTVVIMLPVCAALISIIQWGGEYFYVYAALFLFVFSLFFMTIYPEVIAPLFDKFVPLPEGKLRTQIEELAASISFPLKKIFVVEASKRSSHSNAYFYGFFNNKRIVLFDTLIGGETKKKLDEMKEKEEKKEEEKEEKEVEVEKKEEEVGKKEEEEKKDAESRCSDSELLAVLAHELGHWKMNHTMKNFVFAQVQTLASFYAFGLLMHDKTLFEAFGFPDSQPTLVGLLLIFQFIFNPVNLVVGFLLTMTSRRFEFQADAFAAKLGYAQELQDGLVKLQKGNLGVMNPDSWYSTYHYSHPPLVERLAALEGLQKKTTKKKD
eukprot:Colp12_sorted_trinity150504_noHs@23705